MAKRKIIWSRTAAKNIFVSIAVLILYSSCNLLSIRNISNDFKWKNKKFDKDVGMAILYQPEVTVILPKTKEPLFFTIEDSANIDTNYKIKEILLKKFAKRNLIPDENSPIKLTVEKLKFEEYSESISVDDNSGNFMGMDYKDFFIFEIDGILTKDTIVRKVSIKFQHTTEPRESYVFSGVMVYDGIGASTTRMLENAINLFTYRTYEELEKMK